jgi:hypothetical protein
LILRAPKKTSTESGAGGEEETNKKDGKGADPEGAQEGVSKNELNRRETRFRLH